MAEEHEAEFVEARVTRSLTEGERLRLLREHLGMSEDDFGVYVVGAACGGGALFRAEEKTGPLSALEVVGIARAMGIPFQTARDYLAGRLSLGEFIGQIGICHAGGMLGSTAILAAMKRGQIVIEPFDRERLGPNSYDVTLAPTVATYVNRQVDAAVDNPISRFRIGPEGFLLEPGNLLLGATREYTHSRELVPILDGKSSSGRLGIRIHATAGWGDVGYRGHWTLEIDCVQPVRIYPGMPIGQLSWFTVVGPVPVPYDRRKASNYNNSRPVPMGSAMYKHFPLKGGHGDE